MGPPSLTALGSGDAPWLATAKMPQSAPSPSPMAATEDKQIKALLSALKKHTDALPPEVQALVNESALKDGQTETRQLHSAVAAHGRAKRELQQAQLARHNLHAAWRGFLNQAIDLWKGYSNQFIEQEKQLSERVATAQEALSTAKSHLVKSQGLASAEDKEDAMVSDDEHDKNEKDVTSNTSDRIHQGLTGLCVSLDALKQSADQAVEAEQQALKRPRLEPKDANTAGGADASKPFS